MTKSRTQRPVTADRENNILLWVDAFCVRLTVECTVAEPCRALKCDLYITMASTSGLPPLDPLFKSNAKRTYSVFASYPDAGLREEEKRCV
jgi:hypothetical protein